MRLPRISTLLVAAAAVLCTARPAITALEQPVETVQPIETEEGIWVCTVTVVTYFSTAPPGFSVYFVAAENCFPPRTGEPTNRNVASLFGIKTYADTFHSQHERLIGDTLRVYLDFSEFRSDEKTGGGWSADAVAAATFECVLLAASRDRSAFDYDKKEWTAASFLDVRILGSGKYKSWEKVYSLEKDLAELPRTKVFQY